MKLRVLSLLGGLVLSMAGVPPLSAAGFFYILLHCAAPTHPKIEPFFLINNDIKEKTFENTEVADVENDDIDFNLFDFTIFPNPCRGKKVYLKWRMEHPVPLVARIFNAEGEQVHNFVVPAQEVTDLLWEVSGLPRGSYIFRLYMKKTSPGVPRLLQEAKIYLLPERSK